MNFFLALHVSITCFWLTYVQHCNLFFSFTQWLRSAASQCPCHRYHCWYWGEERIHWLLCKWNKTSGWVSGEFSCHTDGGYQGRIKLFSCSEGTHLMRPVWQLSSGPVLRLWVYFFLYFHFLSTFSRKVQILTLVFEQLLACTDRFNLIILKQLMLIYAVYSRCMLLLSSLTESLPLSFHFAELFYVLKSIKQLIFPTMRQTYLICVVSFSPLEVCDWGED